MDTDRSSFDTGHQALDAISALFGVVQDGLEHGFFEYSLHCETVKDGKRALVIDAGKLYRFTIPPDELHELSQCRFLGLERQNEENR